MGDVAGLRRAATPGGPVTQSSAALCQVFSGATSNRDNGAAGYGDMTLLLGAIAFMSLAISAFAHFCLARKLSEPVPPATELPPISVLKPLRGLDDGLFANLMAICSDDYPDFEVLCCAADPNDPALEVARRVQVACPRRVIHVLCGDVGEGKNPKIRLLRRMLPHAAHDWLLVSDSNVRPEAGYLRGLMATRQKNGAALVHSLLRAVGGRGLGAHLQNLQLNGWVASSVAFADAGRHPGVVGKSMLLDRQALALVGGFEAVQDVLAEDYVLGLCFVRAGRGVALSSHLVPMVSEAMDVGRFFERQVRWGQLRRRVSGALFLGELFVQPLPFFALFAWSGGLEHQLIAGAGMCLKWGLDAVSFMRLDGGSRPWTPLLLPLKDLLVPFIWLVAAFRTRVSWRGHPLRVGAGSRLVPVNPRPVHPWWGRALAPRAVPDRA